MPRFVTSRGWAFSQKKQPHKPTLIFFHPLREYTNREGSNDEGLFRIANKLRRKGLSSSPTTAFAVLYESDLYILDEGSKGTFAHPGMQPNDYLD